MKKIVFTSILKPTDEVRMYERFSISLSKTNKYAINIIGIPPKKEITPPAGIEFHYLTDSQRRLPIRLLNHWQYLKIIHRLRPDIIVLTTPELIPITWIYTRLYTTCVVLDLQEDYRRNITFQRIYGKLARILIRRLLSFIEYLSHKTIDHYFLAERTYADDIPDLRKPFTILENKTAHLDIPATRSAQSLDVIFTGTLSQYAGIFRALDLYDILVRHAPDSHLTVVGYAPDPRVRKVLWDRATSREDMTLIGIDHPVSHDTIVETIQKGNLGLITHEITPLNENRIPTKLFEYSYYDLPFIVERGTSWAQVGAQLGKAIPDSFSAPDPEKIVVDWENLIHAPVNPNRMQCAWSTQSEKFIKAIENLTK